jgi:uncharacterized protein (DUF362 family)
MSQKPYCVRAVQCDYRASDEEVYQHLKQITSPLSGAWDRLRKARRVAIKFNQDGMPGEVVMHKGHRQQLVSDPVARAVLRLLRENTSAELFAVDVGVITPPEGMTRLDCTTLLPILRAFDVPFVDGEKDRVAWVDVPGGGLMFDKYPVPQSTVEADEVISVQKVKNHLFMGVTLSLKNLFGLMPIPPDGRPRIYYHHLVRMPYMLADIARIYDPALNILDALVTQAGEEWGDGEHPRVCNALIAGDHCVATDAYTAHLMGHDPNADWLTPPFHRDRNTLKIAAHAGYGTIDLEQIDVESNVQPPLGEFFSKERDARETVITWRRTTAEQALYYRDHKRAIVEKYAGKYILLQMGEVRWSSDDGEVRESRRKLSGEHPDQAMWMKYVDPDEEEGEHYEIYEQTLRQLEGLGV